MDDKLKGKVENAKGQIKETVGHATNDPELEARGKGDQAAGKGHEALGGAKETLNNAKDAVKKALD